MNIKLEESPFNDYFDAHLISDCGDIRHPFVGVAYGKNNIHITINGGVGQFFEFSIPREVTRTRSLAQIGG